MPIYEFLCQKCRVKSSVLIRNMAEPSMPKCPACDSSDLVRAVSAFSYRKSMKTIHEEYGEPQMFQSPDYYKDPRNIGRWAEKKFKESGMDMPPQIQEEIQAAREGELPESVKEIL
ncbi:zinc ribbon domain-containing protein [Chloroflexota bacterium]